MLGLPAYGLKAYALLYSRYGSSEAFSQSALEWLVSASMRKKIFSLLVWAGWLVKASRTSYRCVSPDEAVRGLLEFRVPSVLKKTEMPYALTGLSAVEAWSDYSYVQRSFERSPYFLKVLKKDLKKWKAFLNAESVPYYINQGSTIGEFVILEPAESLKFEEKDGLKVEPLRKAMALAKKNDLYAYACEYVREKYGV